MDWFKQNRVTLASLTGISVAVGAVWIASGISDGTGETPSRSLASARKIREVQPLPTVRRHPHSTPPKPRQPIRNIRRGDDQREPVVRKRPRGRGPKKTIKRPLVPGC